MPANPSIARVLSATIAGQTFLVYQAGIECTAALSPYGATVPAGGSTGSVGINLPPACSYNTVLGPNWINVTSGASVRDQERWCTPSSPIRQPSRGVGR